MAPGFDPGAVTMFRPFGVYQIGVTVRLPKIHVWEAGAVVSDQATEEVMSWGVGKVVGMAGVVAVSRRRARRADRI